jgi:hypothetical protein
MGRPFEGFRDRQLLFQKPQTMPTGLTTIWPAGNCVSVARAPWPGNLASAALLSFSVSSRIPHHPCRCQRVSLATRRARRRVHHFLMEFQARHAVEEIQKKIATAAAAVQPARQSLSSWGKTPPAVRLRSVRPCGPKRRSSAEAYATLG